MRRLLLAGFCALALCACAKGRTPACSTGDTNRCSCAGGGEGLQQCLPSGDAFGACVCSDACAGGAACVAVPALVGKDMDETGAAVAAAGLLLPDPVDPKGFITVEQIADPPVHVLDQSPPAGTPVKPGTRLTLTVTLPPDQASLGLPNSNFLVGRLQQDTEESAQAYYDVLDPGPFPTRATLADWKAANGFGTPADAEATALYMTHTDLGFGRNMHMRRQGKRVAFYVDNYPSIEDAIAGTRFFATVAMEYSPGPHGKDTDPYFTQFYVFNKRGERIIDPILDDHGPKLSPAVCLVCHGGASNDLTYLSNGGNLGARFIPFDLDAEEFSSRPGYTRADQELAFRKFNEAVLLTWEDAAAQYPPGDPAPVPQLIEGWYGGPGLPGTFNGSATLPGWDVSPEARDLYHKVFAKSCQTCHSQREPSRNYSTYAKFFAAKSLIEQRVFEEGAMPLSQRGSLNFWLSYPHQPKILADWLGTQLRSPGTPVPRLSVTPSTVVTAGTKIVLDGSDSQYAESFDWVETSGPNVQLASETVTRSKVSFVTPARGANLSFELRVSALGRTSGPIPVSILSRSAPDVPQSVAAIPGNASATAQWTAPASDGLSPITGYTITVTPGGATVPAGASATSAVVGSLQPGVTYTFGVAAVNAIGAGDPATVTMRIPTVPGPPVGVTAASTHAGGTLLFNWTPPADTGGVSLSGYTISCSPSGGGTAPGSANSGVVTGLTNGTSYSCTVVATNVAGSSSPSLPATATPDGPPGPPQNFTAASGGGATWNLAWNPPADNGGFPIQKYLVNWTPADGSGGTTFTTAVCSGTACSASVGAADGLVGGVTYTFSLAASNAIGIGVAATTTPPGKPVITSPTAGASTGPNQIPVTWTPAAPNGSTITGYTVQAQVAPAGTITTVSVGGSTTSATITGLLNCTAYNVTVTAASGGGSTASDPVANVTPRQAPDVPVGLSLVKVGGSVGELLFSWGASNPRGCGTVSYTVELTPPVGFASLNSTGTITSFDMVTTTPACPYPSVNCSSPRLWFFRVRASNNGGTSNFSGSVSETPRLGYNRDLVANIWGTAGPSCTGCHAGGNPLHLDGTQSAGSPACVAGSDCSYKSIIHNSPPVIQSPASTSFLVTCPTDFPSGVATGQCFGASGHPGGHRFNVGSVEYNVILRWIVDGNLQ